MIIGINVLENDILNNCPGVLETLLKKNTTKKNIFWATNKYEHLEKSYNFYKVANDTKSKLFNHNLNYFNNLKTILIFSKMRAYPFQQN